MFHPPPTIHPSGIKESQLTKYYSDGNKVTHQIYMQWRPVLRSWQNLASMRLYRSPKSERRTNDIKARHHGAVSSSSSSSASSSQVYNALRSFHGSAGSLGCEVVANPPLAPFCTFKRGLPFTPAYARSYHGRHLNLRAGWGGRRKEWVAPVMMKPSPSPPSSLSPLPSL